MTSDNHQSILSYIAPVAPLLVAIGLVVMNPQIEQHLALQGQSLSFLRSVKVENDSWVNSHIFLLLGFMLYPVTFFWYCTKMFSKNPITSAILLISAYFGCLGIIGQLGIDFVYGILSQEKDLELAQRIRTQILIDPIISTALNIIPNLLFVSALFFAGTYTILAKIFPKISGILIIGGILILLLLNGKIQFIEAVGHSLVFFGFLIASIKLIKRDYSSSSI